MSKTVYLAGPIRGLKARDSTTWRSVVTDYLKEMGIEALDPMRHKPWIRAEVTVLDAYPEQPLGSGRGILERDMWDVRRCDAVLVVVAGASTASVGTCMEVGAAFVLQKPIVIVIEAEDNDPPNPHDHAMFLATTPYVVDDLTVALRILRGLLC